MAKPEWGTKRTCPSCGAKFYDLRRAPIHCPKCASVFEPDAVVRHRPSSVAGKKAKAAPVVAPLAAVEPDLGHELIGEDDDAELLADVEEEEEDIDEADGDQEEDALMEDASDLGGDDEDMAEVIEHIEDDREG